MKKKHKNYDEDHSNQFGAENGLETSGGIFDLYKNIQHNVSETHMKDDIGSNPNHAEVPSAAEEIKSSDSANTQTGDIKKPDAKTKKAAKGSKLKKAVVMFAAVLAAAAGITAFVFFNFFIVLGDLFGSHEIYPTWTERLDLSGRSYDNYSALGKLKKLRYIDLTDSSFDDLSALYGCTALKEVRLSDRVIEAENCIEFYSNAQEAMLICRIDINGNDYDSEVTEITAVGCDDETQKLYASLKNLSHLDLTGCSVNTDTYTMLSAALPKCVIKAKIQINGKECLTDEEHIKISGVLTNEDIALLSYFSHLKSIDVSECTNPDDIKKVTSNHSGIQIIRAITVLNKTFLTSDEVMDLRGSQYTLTQVKEALKEAIPQMTALKKIDMCGCGLTDEEMEELCNTYPKIKFVWIIHLRFWDVRTDAVIFSSLNGVHFSSEKVYEPIFKYCTDLVALDLGHNLLSDISKISSLKKLRAAILMDNRLTDISALSELKELEFLEININRIQSVKPLENLQNLMYVDFWSSMGLTDLSPLYHHDKLKIAIFHKTVPDAERKRFKESNPQCQTFYEVDSLKVTTNIEWRSSDYRKKLKPAFTDWKYVVGFDEKTGEFIYDYNTDQYAYM